MVTAASGSGALDLLYDDVLKVSKGSLLGPYLTLLSVGV